MKNSVQAKHNLCQKHYYLLGKIEKADETPFFLDAKTAVYAQGSKSVLVKTTRHEKLRITVVPSVLADGS